MPFVEAFSRLKIIWSRSKQGWGKEVLSFRKEKKDNMLTPLILVRLLLVRVFPDESDKLG